MATQRRGIQSVEISALVLEALEEAGGAVPLSKLAAMTNMQLRLSRGSEPIVAAIDGLASSGGCGSVVGSTVVPLLGTRRS